MQILGPQRYQLSVSDGAFAVQCPKGSSKFWGIATTKKPKLYVVSIDERPIYVGTTRQSIRNRLRYGWNPKGARGYHGYKWRGHFKTANLDVWIHDDPPAEFPRKDIETVEAEVVFLIRSADQWPLYQTEIHFHASNVVHRHAAAVLASSYDLHLPKPS